MTVCEYVIGGSGYLLLFRDGVTIYFRETLTFARTDWSGTIVNVGQAFENVGSA